MKELVQGILKTGFKPSRLASEPKYPTATHASFLQKRVDDDEGGSAAWDSRSFVRSVRKLGHQAFFGGKGREKVWAHAGRHSTMAFR